MGNSEFNQIILNVNKKVLEFWTHQVGDRELSQSVSALTGHITVSLIGFQLNPSSHGDNKVVWGYMVTWHHLIVSTHRPLIVTTLSLLCNISESNLGLSWDETWETLASNTVGFNQFQHSWNICCCDFSELHPLVSSALALHYVSLILILVKIL